MSVGDSLTRLLLLCFVWTFTRADDVVSCVFKTSCILPCRFQPGPETVIHWILVSAGDLPVHAFYKDENQLSRQSQRFRGRTSLFNGEISEGNASLRLTGLEILDRGRYKCYTSTKPGVSKESFIDLRVDAPVRKVNLVKVKNVVTCSSEGIYPEPELTWSNLTQQHEPKVQKDERLLYNISSSVALTDTDDNLDYYSCNVTTSSSSRKTTLFKTTHMNVSDSECTVTCLTVNTKPLSRLTWTFNTSEIIVTWRGGSDQYTATPRWVERVKDVSASGSLELRDLSADRTGTYTCEVSDARETYINNTFLRIEDRRVSSSSVVGIVLGVLVAVAAIALGIFLYIKIKGPRQYHQP